MNIHFDDILKIYKSLLADDASAWDIYAGENFQEMAEKKGIPENKWANDRVEMQLGQEVIAEELSKEIPSSAQEQKARLRAFIEGQVSSRLKVEGDAAAQKGLLLRGLQAGQNMDSVELAKLGRKSMEELKEAFVSLAMDYTYEMVLPVIQHQCSLLLLEPERQGVALNNAGALAAASYLQVPELRQQPFTLGAVSEVISQWAKENKAEILQEIAFGLLLVAGIMAGIALMVAEASVVGAAAAYVVTEGTLAGLGGAVTSEIALAAGFIGKLLVCALGSAVLGGATKLLAGLCARQAETDEDVSSPSVAVQIMNN